MRIAILSKNIIPGGGTERAISNMVAIFHSIGIKDINIISISSRNTDTPFFNFDASISHLGFNPLPSAFLKKIKWYFNVLLKLRSHLKNLQFDIIFSDGHNTAPLLYLSKFNAKRIYSCEHIAFHTIPKINRFLLKFIYPKLNGIIVLSHKAAELLKPYNRSIYVIPNSICANGINCNTSDTNKSLIMVGRISDEKGYERIIPIAARIKKELPNCHIDIYGDGPLKYKLCSLISESDLDDYIILHGNTSEINTKYQNSDILLMTSYTEAMPMVILEAASHGLPVIAYRNEGTELLIKNGYNGFLIDSDNVEAFAEHIKALINNNNLRQRLSQNALKNIEEYSPDNITIKWKQLIFNEK